MSYNLGDRIKRLELVAEFNSRANKNSLILANNDETIVFKIDDPELWRDDVLDFINDLSIRHKESVLGNLKFKKENTFNSIDKMIEYITEEETGRINNPYFK